MDTAGLTRKGVTVRTKLAMVFGALTAVVMLVAGMSLRSLDAEHDAFVNYIRVIEVRAQAAEAIRASVGARAIAARDLVLVTRAEDIAAEQRAVAAAHQDVQRHVATLTQSVTSHDVSDQARQRVAAIARVESSYGPVALSIVELALAGRRAEATSMISDQCRPLLAALVKATDDYVAYARDEGDRMIEASDASFVMQRNLMIGLCVLAVLLAIGAGVWITRGLMHALGAEPAELARISQAVAQGDLSPVAGATGAPKASVLASMAGMQHSLLTLIGQVRLASDNVASGASQIAAGNADLSQRTEEQATALQDTAAHLETLSTTVRQNAQTAHEANLLAAQASTVAATGSDAVAHVAARMTHISDSSTRIADITSIIEGIAFQTNILALNAAVEAARAGEQGRGFAVVAAEVRSLAQRSSNAAKDIKGLINASLEQIHEGSTLAVQAGATMNDVTAAVQRVTVLIDNMASASAEQSGDIERVSQSMGELDSATQQNAALVEQAAAAAASLEDQGRRLKASVALFHWRADADSVSRHTVEGGPMLTPLPV